MMVKRKEIIKTVSKTDPFILQLFFDPTKTVHKGHGLPIFLVLIPVVIFFGSLLMTMFIDFYYDYPSSVSHDPFRVAVGLNKLIYLLLSVLGIILMSLSLRKLFWTTYP